MIELRGFEDVIRYLGTCADETIPHVARALKDVTESLVGEHVIPATPIEFGPLRASTRVSYPVIGAGGILVEITVGGPSAGYAIYVHEILRYKHLPPTRAKFLSEPAYEQFPHMMVSMWARTLALFQQFGA